MISPRVHRILLEYAQMTVAKARGKLMRKPLPSDSPLVRNIEGKVYQNGTVKFSYYTYGEYVDKGRRKGATPPPIEPIKEWVKRKGIDISPYAIQKSIGKKGIKPYRWIDQSFPSNENPNSRPSLELEALWERLTIMQIEDDMDLLD
jgi:hypothetical protein